MAIFVTSISAVPDSRCNFGGVRKETHFRLIWALFFAAMSLVCWVVLPSGLAWQGEGEETAWMLADAEEERGEDNKQGEEEASDDEVKKWSEGSSVRLKRVPLMFQWQGMALQWTWEDPHRKGLFEPPEMKG